MNANLLRKSNNRGGSVAMFDVDRDVKLVCVHSTQGCRWHLLQELRTPGATMEARWVLDKKQARVLAQLVGNAD